MNRGLVCLVLAIVLIRPAIGQENPATIRGTVANLDGSPFPGAAIQATNSSTEEVFTTNSSPTGEYTLPVPPGSYVVAVNGFFAVPFEREDVVIRAGETLDLDVELVSVTLDTVGENAATFGALISRMDAPPEGPAPRLPDGRPDLSGSWTGLSAAPPPESDTPELLPWAQAIAEERLANNFRDLPSARCLPADPGLTAALSVMRIVHSPDILVNLLEGDPVGYRQVFLDGRSHPEDLEPTWTGHSIGRWEGDTLVVETIGLNDQTWLMPPSGALIPSPHTERLRVTTRIRRPDLGHLEVEATYDDPETFRQPWTARQIFILAPGMEVQEYLCPENNQYVGGSGPGR